MLLAACDVPPPYHPGLETVPKWHFETEEIRRAVDDYKTQPSTRNARRVQEAFAKFDRRMAEMKARVKQETGESRTEMEEEIALLSRHREIHRARYAAAPPQVPVRVAERIAPARARRR